ncbi:SOS response-associated peptidase [Longirhabdus pacifica]|uniref:SOS response-associated peptidase n=1 Tax=Longirhabdus pacifica TaxID=2305227 RepID=UPI001008F9C7|nr:SOS response-associated peptidase [Longirhabdus pacifica]
MCGRFTLTAEEETILSYLNLDHKPMTWKPRYNIAPTQSVLSCIKHQDAMRIGTLQWGLIPHWAKDSKIGSKLINARSETVMQKPSFKNSFARKRCIIIADGFFEWKQNEDGKQPLYITLKDQPLFAMAGLYDTWQDEHEKKIHTCTILTTKANTFMEHIHQRMPVILKRNHIDSWLMPKQSIPTLQSLMQPYHAHEMRAIPVTKKMGNAAFDSPECIQPI